MYQLSNDTALLQVVCR